MSTPVHHEAPDLPAFNLPEVHRLQADLMGYAEKLLGPRSHKFNIAPARFVMGTTGSTERIGNEITIELELNAAKDWQCCVAELGHELVHALDGLTGYPTVLEEGIACAFGLGQCAAMFDGDTPLYLCKARYRQALQLAVSLPTPFAVVKRLRAQGIPLCRVAPKDLMNVAPSIGPTTAELMCRRFG